MSIGTVSRLVHRKSVDMLVFLITPGTIQTILPVWPSVNAESGVMRGPLPAARAAPRPRRRLAPQRARPVNLKAIFAVCVICRPPFESTSALARRLDQRRVEVTNKNAQEPDCAVRWGIPAAAPAPRLHGRA